MWFTIFEGTLFFGGVLLHESAHAVAARGFGLPVAGITLVFWGGATETASNAKGPLAEFVIAFVGPATTLLLSAAFWVAARNVDPGITRMVLGELAWLNLLIGGVNALPGFPLDGGRMLLAATWGFTKNRRTAVLVAGYGAVVIGIALIGAAILTFRGTTGLWLFFGYLGFVMLTTGRGTPQRVQARDVLAVGTASDAMRPPPTEQIPASISLSEASARWLRDEPDRTFPVTEAGRVVGTVSMDSAKKVGARDPLRPVRDGIDPAEPDAGRRADRPAGRRRRVDGRPRRPRAVGRRPRRSDHRRRRGTLVPAAVLRPRRRAGRLGPAAGHRRGAAPADL